MTIEKVLATKPNENFVFSLINIHHAFALAMLGADGETAGELAKLIGYDEDPSKCLDGLKQKLADFASLSSINQSAGVFINDKMSLKEAYLQSAKSELGAIADSFDASNSEKSAEKINQWVSSKTAGKINDIIKPTFITSNTLSILLSTTLFKGTWAEEFCPDDHKVFYTQPGKSTETKFMKLSKKRHFNSYIGDDLTMVGIPYDDDMTMTLLMPKLGELSNFEKNLNNIPELLEQCRFTNGEVVLKMPKFNLKSELDLKQMFSSFGHGKLFSQAVQHNYSKMTDSDVFISDAVHQATIEVDEKGTVAAAATAVVMMLRCMPAPPVHITIDRPFLFLLHKNENILFAGRVVNPQ